MHVPESCNAKRIAQGGATVLVDTEANRVGGLLDARLAATGPASSSHRQAELACRLFLRGIQAQEARQRLLLVKPQSGPEMGEI